MPINRGGGAIASGAAHSDSSDRPDAAFPDVATRTRSRQVDVRVHSWADARDPAARERFCRRADVPMSRRSWPPQSSLR
jgi:hypothetical protein